jgi:DNA-directed RNA polymerase subunit M/transcription elongation factor TFIIS
MTIRELHGNETGPSCHICGAIMLRAEKGWKCQACGASTEPTEVLEGKVEHAIRPEDEICGFRSTFESAKLGAITGQCVRPKHHVPANEHWYWPDFSATVQQERAVASPRCPKCQSEHVSIHYYVQVAAGLWESRGDCRECHHEELASTFFPSVASPDLEQQRKQREQSIAQLKGACAYASGFPIDANHGYADANADAWRHGWEYCRDFMRDPETPRNKSLEQVAREIVQLDTLQHCNEWTYGQKLQAVLDILQEGFGPNSKPEKPK